MIIRKHLKKTVRQLTLYSTDDGRKKIKIKNIWPADVGGKKNPACRRKKLKKAKKATFLFRQA